MLNLVTKEFPTEIKLGDMRYSEQLLSELQKIHKLKSIELESFCIN